MNRRFAILDLGTNTFHLLIAQLREGEESHDIIYREKIAVKIGEGGISQGTISKEAIKRALKACVHFKAVCERYKTSHITTFATSAFRNAKNGIELAQKIERMSGIKVKIISGHEEAELIYFGVKKALSIGSETSLILDIGGGSNEFIICNENQIFWKESYEIGAQRLLDAFHQNDPISAKELVDLNEFLRFKLASLTTAINIYNPKILIGASGTFDTMAEIHRSLKNRIKMPDETEYEIPISYYQKIHKNLIAKDRQARVRIPGMIEMRADMIVVASCVISFVLNNYPIDRIRTSSCSLKEGVLDQILNKIQKNILA